MSVLFCDIETYSEVSLKTHGSYAYSEKAEIMLFTYAFCREPVKLWDKTRNSKMPSDLEHYLNDPDIVTVWHNGGGFDRLIAGNHDDL